MAGKVLITASTYSHIRNFHLPYLEMFQRAGWQTHVACGGADTDIPFADTAIPVPFCKKMTASGNFRAAARLRRQIRAESYDLVITHTSLAAFFTRLAMLGMKRRPAVINMVHGYLFDRKTGWLKRWLLLAAERLTAPVTDLILTMNGEDYEIACQHKLGRRVEPVPGVGVDFARLNGDRSEEATRLRWELGIDPNAFVLFYAAELSGRKSQSVLIRAMEHLPERVVLVLAGEGTAQGTCRRLAQRLGVSARVLFPGHVTDLSLWYAMADAVVPSSRSEGLPFNVMEAMYCGLPVAASAVKGHRDLICHEETGLLYPYGDAGACAEAVGRLSEDPELARRLGQSAREQAAQYGLDRVKEVVFARYMSCVDESKQ